MEDEECKGGNCCRQRLDAMQEWGQAWRAMACMAAWVRATVIEPVLEGPVAGSDGLRSSRRLRPSHKQRDMRCDQRVVHEV